MLLQLEHQHPRNPEGPSPKQDSPASAKPAKKTIDPPQQPESVFFNPQFYHQTSSFNFHIDGLEQLRRQAHYDMPPYVLAFIEERKKFSEQRVYNAIANTSVEFVGLHLQEFPLGLKHEMQGLFENIHNSVEAGIWDGRYEIAESKNKYFSMAKKEQEMLTMITGELVRRNLDSFREELQMDEDLQVSAEQHHAKSENYKTKKAESFVRSVQEEQRRHRQVLNKQLEARRQWQAKTQQQREQSQVRKRQQKQQLMRQRMQMKSQMMAMQKQHRQKIHSEYLQMVSNYKKPLHEEKEEQFRKKMMDEQKKKYKVMQEIRDQKRSIPYDQIQEHMERYQELLQEHESFREQQKELREHQSELIREKRPYRSKFYSLVLKDSPKPDDRDLRTSMIKKQVDYAEHVKRHFMPKTDERKQQELQQLIRKVGSHKKHVYHSRKYIEQGKRNLEKLHLLIGELRAKNMLKENIGLETIPEQKPVKKYKNYLQQIKQSKLKDGEEEGVDFEQHIAAGKDDGWIKMQANKKEEKARLKQLYLDSAMESIDIHSHMKGKNMIQQNYIEAAKAKMALLKKYSQTIPVSKTIPVSTQQT